MSSYPRGERRPRTNSVCRSGADERGPALGPSGDQISRSTGFGSRSALEGRDLLSQGRLLVGGLVHVNDALGGGLVELTRGSALVLDGLLDVTRGNGLASLADRGLQRGLDGLVAQPGLLVGLVPLDLGLDVRHE